MALRGIEMNEPSKFMTTAEVAELFKVSEKTVARWVDLGQVPYLRLPGTGDKGQRKLVRFDREHIEKWTARRMSVPGASRRPSRNLAEMSTPVSTSHGNSAQPFENVESKLVQQTSKPSDGTVNRVPFVGDSIALKGVANGR